MFYYLICFQNDNEYKLKAKNSRGVRGFLAFICVFSVCFLSYFDDQLVLYIRNLETTSLNHFLYNITI